MYRPFAKLSRHLTKVSGGVQNKTAKKVRKTFRGLIEKCQLNVKTWGEALVTKPEFCSRRTRIIKKALGCHKNPKVAANEKTAKDQEDLVEEIRRHLSTDNDVVFNACFANYKGMNLLNEKV